MVHVLDDISRFHLSPHNFYESWSQGRGGDELSGELSSALQRCLLGGKSGEGTSTGNAVQVLLYYVCDWILLCLTFFLVYFGAGAGIDLSSLCIVQGKVCWDLYIDCLVVSSDGNVLDALGAAIKVFPFISMLAPYQISILQIHWIVL